MKPLGSTRTVALVLCVAVVLPALFYSVYQINALSTSEEIVAEVYRRQLDVALFSINQYSLDVAGMWASSLGLVWSATAPGLQPALAPFFARNPSITGVFLADSSGGRLRYFPARPGMIAGEADECASALNAEREKIAHLIRYSRQGYRKIEPIAIGDSVMRRRPAGLLFVANDRAGNPYLSGMRIDAPEFVRDVLANRLREVAGDEFAVAVLRRNSDETLFATAAVNPADLTQRRQLWIFPDLAVGIRLSGATIEEISRSRFKRNLFLILLLDVVLIAGVFFVFRSVRREMDMVRMRSDFVSNVSHELRTPLSLIRMYAETLEMGRIAGKEKKQEYYATIVQETDRLTRLVNNLLNFSRMEAGRKPYTLAVTDLNVLVRNVLASFGPHLANKGFSPVLSLAPLIPTVAADGEAVQEALINLLDNAVKYSDTDKYIRIATRVTGADVRIEVEDHGIGIAQEHAKKVFETFYRVSDERARNATGSGLGLSIAKHIMDAHGGRIDLTSVPGKGSTFILVFPAAPIADHANSRL